MSRAQTYDPKKRNDLLSPGTNDDSPRNSKGSFGSQDSDLSFEKYDVDAMDENDRYNSSTKGFETRTSSNTFHESGTAYNQEIDDFDALKNDPIFHRLCPRNQYADTSNCKVCGKGFSKIKLISKKHCKFCGECVCEDHSKKKRPNPENASEYVRVCDICDEKWINRTIMGEFYEKLKSKEKEIEILEKQIREQQVKIENEQKEHDALILMRNRNEKNYTDQINILQSEIQKVKEETRKCERENTELSKEFNHTQDKVTQLDTDISRAEDEYKRLSKEATELTYKIEAINQDIAQTNREIRNIEEYITQNKTPGVMSYNDVRSRISKNGDFRNASEYSSVVSETLPNGKKGHYNRSTLRQNQAKANANVEPRSGNCDIKCNIF